MARDGEAAGGDAPLILTLGFDDESFRHFDGMRRRHFPQKRNVIPAHLTLFHHLEPARLAQIVEDIDAVAARTAPLPLTVTGLRFLGYGSAYTIESSALNAMRAALATRWHDDLGRQDRQGFKAHVTIQNKAPAPQARALYDELDAGFRPFEAMGDAMLLWRYLGGPWDLVRRFDLTGG